MIEKKNSVGERKVGQQGSMEKKNEWGGCGRED